ncbi:MAG: hypothetical protein Q4D24_10950 [Erysipelotrichaceae bacterium]|nr:hypothetical protein [Erysipelotrichaceae bacterium]
MNSMHMIRKRILFLLFLAMFCTCVIPVCAGGMEVNGPEYFSILSGKYPKEVTFTDTMTSDSNGKCASVMTELSGPGVGSPDDHVFTAHPGERFSFKLASPARLTIPFFTTHFEEGGRMKAVHADGKGIYELQVISQFLEVSDFGFDTDLSDTSANVTLTFTGIGTKIADSGLEKKPDDEIINKNVEKNERAVITVTAKARASLIMLNDLSEYTCSSCQYEEKNADSLADSTAFDFVLEDTVWTISVGEDTQNVSSAVIQEYENYNGPAGLYYHTPAVVLVGSDLYPRDSLPTDGFDYTEPMQQNDEQLEKNNSRLNRLLNPKNQETEKQKPSSGTGKTKVTLTKGSLVRKGPGNILSIFGIAVLAALTAAGAALISSASSGAASAASSSTKETKASGTLTVNDGDSIPAILAGCGRPVSVPVTLEGTDEAMVTWLVTVLPDPDKELNQRLENLMAECAGGNAEARLNILCGPVSEDFHATLCVSALSAKDRTVLATKLSNVKVRIPGIHTKEDNGETKVFLVNEGAVPGSARETELKENEYEVLRDENGKDTYQLKNSGKEKLS